MGGKKVVKQYVIMSGAAARTLMARKKREVEI